MLCLPAVASSSQCRFERFELYEMHLCYFSSSAGARSFVPFFSVGGAGERSLSGGSPPLSPAHQHASFNHLHIFIIHIPQAMNYSTLQFPHENSERRHEECLFPVFSLFSLFLSSSPSFPSGSVSLSLMHHCHSGTARTKDGDALASRKN